MKPNLLSEDKVIITAAITGGIHGKAQNPNIPEQPEEQAQAALDCYNAGAAVLHLHVRGPNGMNTPDIAVYNTAVRLIGEKSPIIRQIGNGIGAYLDENGEVKIATLEQRLKLLTIEPQAEMHTLNAGTFEFRTKYGSALFENPVWFNEQYVTGCNEQNIGIEIEVYDISHIHNVLELVDRGVLKGPLHFSFVMGIMGGIPADPGHLLSLINEIPEGSSWQVITIGRYQLKMTSIGMALGGNIRTGMEDNIYYGRGDLAESNAQLVERMVRIAREMGRDPATVDEAKQMLHLKR
jgi:3-keto-5-aminohexanoate cleavage enzyme